MVKMINALTGTVMLVADERVKEYEKRGHKVAEAPAPKKEEEPKKKPAAKKGTKK